MADAIRLLSRSTVRPENNDHHDEFRRRIELTPFDLHFLQIGYIQRGLLFQKPTTSDISQLVERLKATLSRTLDMFYPLAGRLAIAVTENHGDNDTATSFIDCSGQGALFVHATADGIAMADVLEPVVVPVEIINAFFLMNGVWNREAAISGLPLLAVQVTELTDGCVFVACSMNHCIGDGTTFWHFFNVWSEISRRGDGVLPTQYSRPFFGRDFLDGVVDLPISVPFSRYQVLQRLVPTTTTLQSRVVQFSKEKIAELKAKANAETGTNAISSLQALMGHLWVCITRSRRLDADEEVSYTVAVGLRPRLRPPLPQEYFGNAAKVAVVKTTAGELLERGMGWAAQQINSAIAALTPSDARKLFEDFAKLILQQPSRETLIAASSVVTGSSQRFDVYGNDFGWGRPLAMHTGQTNRFDGLAMVFPGAKEGSIEFHLSLPPEAIQALASNSEFAETLAK